MSDAQLPYFTVIARHLAEQCSNKSAFNQLAVDCSVNFLINYSWPPFPDK